MPKFYLINSLIIALLLLMFAPASHAEWYKDEQAIMGTSILVEVWNTDADKAQEGIDAVIQEMHRIDNLMSPFKKDSELSLVNREAADHPVKISRELFNLIDRSLYVSRISDGVFDITFSSVGYMYDYRKGIKPTDEQIKEELPNIDYRLLILDSKRTTIQFARKGVRIDLGGIAKGYAVDNGVKILRDMGFREALVTAGGDSRILGDRNGRPWMMGIRDPRKKAGEAAVVIPLSDTAISTSGDYERFFERDGVRYHHILNPRTGKSAHNSRSVTVIGPEGTTTDAFTKPVFILGWEKGLKFIESQPGYEAVVTDSTGRIHYSSGLEPPPSPESEHAPPH